MFQKYIRNMQKNLAVVFSSWYCHGGFFFSFVREVKGKLFFSFKKTKQAGQKSNALGSELTKQEGKQKG